jgi:myo-inositol-1(or 4)-monophosphatase
VTSGAPWRTEGAPRLAAAARLARLAGRVALERWPKGAATWKDDGSMVTDADISIQSLLEGEIAAGFPEDGVLGEEGPAARRLDAPHVWVVDPIDGTNNFGRGLPGFSVSVGVLRYGRPFCGAVYDPVADQLFRGLVGHGAWLNERPLRVTAPLFPLDPDGYRGEPIAFLAGDPLAHDESLREMGEQEG